MYRHPHFDLLMHDDGELADFINGSVYQRATLHEWPLSCVQRVIHYDARRYIYKAQSGPTVEAEFYAAARSPLLVSARTLYRDERYACLLLEHLEAPRLDALSPNPQAAVSVVDCLLDEIAQIEIARPWRNFPHYLDLRTPKKWLALIAETHKRLAGLVEAGLFHQVSLRQAQGLKAWASSPEVLEIYQGPVGLVHGDLAGDNVFCLADGSYRVVDWQRPILGPTIIDRVTLLSSLGVDPARHASPGARRMRDFLLVHWFVECAWQWFPPGRAVYDRMVAELLVE